MDQPPAQRRRFALADMLLLFIGLGIGFALMAHFRAEEQRRRDLPENSGRTETGPIASLYVGVALGMAIAFPMLRLRECHNSPATRRLRLSDVFGLWPGAFIVLVALMTATEPLRGWPNVALGIITLFGIFAQIPLAVLSVLLAMNYFSDREGNWLDLFACATNTANGLMVLLALSSF